MLTSSGHSRHPTITLGSLHTLAKELFNPFCCDSGLRKFIGLMHLVVYYCDHRPWKTPRTGAFKLAFKGLISEEQRCTRSARLIDHTVWVHLLKIFLVKLLVHSQFPTSSHHGTNKRVQFTRLANEAKKKKNSWENHFSDGLLGRTPCSKIMAGSCGSLD